MNCEVKDGTTKDSTIVKNKAPTKPKFVINAGVSKNVAQYKKKSMLKSSGVITKEVIYEETQQNKKYKAIGLLKRVKKLMD